ncbi:hypothetical protein I6H48_07630 [Corynebacterium amycolatum]|uniref:Uncharacterized protein n=1 Tax=Corynebacterium amycolatum TaxID=43765 RepID=A0A7T4KNY6_CORAY|nr:hypothetical protein [Corynebacterium amycolatum]QQB81849.1 hypothetical protein I6H48_07630 [Corynebacterium amycolatum]
MTDVDAHEFERVADVSGCSFDVCWWRDPFGVGCWVDGFGERVCCVVEFVCRVSRPVLFGELVDVLV